MKRFYSKRNRKKNKLLIIIISVFVMNLVIFNVFGERLGESISYSAKMKIEELTKYYLNDVIKNYLNVDTSDYIKINLVNNNIVNVDIDNNKCNILLKDIISDLEGVVKSLEKGEVSEYNNLEMLRGNDGIVVLMPVGVVMNNSLFSRLGPKVPVKISFLENIEAYVDVVVENYGINNSLVKLYININIEEVIEIPINKDKSNIEYRFLVASKLINGEVPSMIGNALNSSSNIVNSSVN